jgi:hypothetical protein
MSARRQLVSTGRGGTKRAQRAQRTHRTHRQDTGAAVPAVPAVPAGQAITCAECRVQAKSAAAALGAWTTSTPGPRWARPAHAPKAPCTGRAVGWRNLERQTHSPVASSLPFLLRDIRRAAPVVCSPLPHCSTAYCFVAPLLHCSTAPLLHCPIPPPSFHSLPRPPAEPTKPTRPFTHPPIHPLTRSLTHPPTHSLYCVGVGVGACVCALSAPSSFSLLPHHHTTLLGSALLPAITSLGACCSHSLPLPRTHRPSCEWARPLVPRPSLLPATSLFCPVCCLCQGP